jgi:hypothetical protein
MTPRGTLESLLLLARKFNLIFWQLSAHFVYSLIRGEAFAEQKLSQAVNDNLGLEDT